MLPRSARLRRSREIQRVVHEGRVFVTTYLKVYRAPSLAPDTRVACVVGKTVHRSAVARHRYQRWLRALARELLSETVLASPYDMVWVARPSIAAASLHAVRADLESHRAEILG
jgi:ribonuclease P protein component